MTWTAVSHLAGALLLAAGSFFILVAAIGLLRFDDLLKRMHAAAKPQTFGTMLLMAGLALVLPSPATIWTLLLVVAFVLVTSPISAHLASRAGYRTGHVPSDQLIADDYRADLDRVMQGSGGRCDGEPEEFPRR
ncbi:MAG: monovalent cation/H(+) antiporter subunit G [Bowdeniella nasicola]|nr:monovalent cation/H(+) antiporter subunit G [Bowdeniella nasicola]